MSFRTPSVFFPWSGTWLKTWKMPFDTNLMAWKKSPYNVFVPLRNVQKKERKGTRCLASESVRREILELNYRRTNTECPRGYKKIGPIFWGQDFLPFPSFFYYIDGLFFKVCVAVWRMITWKQPQFFSLGQLRSSPTWYESKQEITGKGMGAKRNNRTSMYHTKGRGGH